MPQSDEFEPTSFSADAETAPTERAPARVQELAVDLKLSQARLELALGSADLGTWSYDGATGLLTGDERTRKIYGAPFSEAPVERWIELVHPDDRKPMAEEFGAGLQREGQYEIEYRLLHGYEPAGGDAEAAAGPAEGAKAAAEAAALEAVNRQAEHDPERAGSIAEERSKARGRVRGGATGAKGGFPRWVRAKGRVLRETGGWAQGEATDGRRTEQSIQIIGIVEDITPRKHAQVLQAMNDAREAVLVGLMQGQRTTIDPDEIMRATSRAIGQHLAVDRVGFFECAQDHTITFASGWLAGPLPALTASVPTASLGKEYLASLRAGKPVAISAMEFDPEDCTDAEVRRAGSLAAAALAPRIERDEGGEDLPPDLYSDRAGLLPPLGAGGSNAGLNRRSALSLGGAAVAAQTPVCASIDAPIHRENRMCAGFYVHHSAKRMWTAEEIAFVQEAAEQTWDAVHRARSQRQLRISEERLRTAIEASQGIGMWDWDVASGMVIGDEVFARNYGIDPELAAAGVPILDTLRLVHPDDLERTTRAITDTLARVTGTDVEFCVEYRLLRPDGSAIWVVSQGTLLVDEERRHFSGLNFNITQRKQTELALRQSEKLAAVGRLASSIAHEINNPLEAVTNLIYLACGAKDVGQIQGYLEVAERELRRISVITSQTLSFHKESTTPRKVTSEELLSSVLTIYQGRLASSRIAVEHARQSPEAVLCFDGEIRQVLNNLVANAIDAIHATHEGSGRLVVRSHAATHGKTGKRGLRIVIADTGAGMSAITRRKLFEPFFTTKGAGGAGLGLSVSKDIIDRHRGTLRVRSRQGAGHGTVFALFLPFDGVS